MKTVEELRISLFSDGADLAGILEMYANPWIRGFTTNPTLMRKAGVRDYEAFARSLLRTVPDRPISLEVFADDEEEMESQALTIATWGANVNVKVPVTNRSGVFMGPLIRKLAEAGVALNVTAILTLEQVVQVVEALLPETWAIVSVFAGRIADTGVDPVPLMAEAKRILRWRPRGLRHHHGRA
jgi:transaldolase